MFGINATKVTTWREVFGAPGVPGPTGTTIANPLLTATGGVNGLAPSAANLVAPQRPLGRDTVKLSAANVLDVAMHGTAFLPNLLADVQLPWVPGGLPPAAGANTFSSRADALEITAGGLIYQNRKAGDFTKMRSASGDFEIQAHQELCHGTPVTTKLAVKLGCDVVTVDASTHRLTVNGLDTVLQPGQSLALPMQGGTITRTTAGTYLLTSAQGDLVSVAEHDPGYIDFFGTPSFTRQAGDLKGELGTGDGASDLVGRDGKTYAPTELEAFQETWRVPAEASLFGAFPQASCQPGTTAHDAAGSVPSPTPVGSSC